MTVRIVVDADSQMVLCCARVDEGTEPTCGVVVEVAADWWERFEEARKTVERMERELDALTTPALEQRQAEARERALEEYRPKRRRLEEMVAERERRRREREGGPAEA